MPESPGIDIGYVSASYFSYLNIKCIEILVTNIYIYGYYFGAIKFDFGHRRPVLGGKKG